MSLSVVTFKWKPVAHYRTQFEARHVNTLARMIARHYKGDYELVCCTDDPTDIDPSVRIMKLWDDHASLPSPHGGTNPACYRRLKLFDREFTKDRFRERIVSIDLDAVVVANINPLWDRDEPLMFWGDDSRTTPYNGSMWMLRNGAAPEIWDKFDPRVSPQVARAVGYHGSDQAWLSFICPRVPRWTSAEHGVASFREHIRKNDYKLFPNTRIVFFNGHIDPWSPQARRLAPWVDAHYR